MEGIYKQIPIAKPSHFIFGVEVSNIFIYIAKYYTLWSQRISQIISCFLGEKQHIIEQTVQTLVSSSSCYWIKKYLHFHLEKVSQTCYLLMGWDSSISTTFLRNSFKWILKFVFFFYVKAVLKLREYSN